MSKTKERIILVRPFAYVDLFDWEDAEVSIQTKGKIIEGKRLLWRLYWVGFP